MNTDNLNNYKKMKSFVGKKNSFLGDFLPVYDATSIYSALKTYLCGHSKKTYNGSIMELLGKSAIDIFNEYQVWGGEYSNDSYYIRTGGFDGISFSFDKDFIINYVSYGRTLNGEAIIEKAKEYALINHFGLKITRHGNMRGIYYDVSLIDPYIETPYIGIESNSTFRDGGPDRKLIML